MEKDIGKNKRMRLIYQEIANIKKETAIEKSYKADPLADRPGRQEITLKEFIERWHQKVEQEKMASMVTNTVMAKNAGSMSLDELGGKADKMPKTGHAAQEDSTDRRAERKKEASMLTSAGSMSLDELGGKADKMPKTRHAAQEDSTDRRAKRKKEASMLTSAESISLDELGGKADKIPKIGHAAQEDSADRQMV